MMTILYEVHGSLYINLTNRCPADCVFCLRNSMDSVYGSDNLWLEHEPSVDEVIRELQSAGIEKYKEIVFCGFGEPTERLDDLLAIAKFIKEKYNKPIRVNTNGLTDLIHGKDTTPMFEGLVDTVSISLNTPDKDKYFELTRNIFGRDSFDAVLKFAGNVRKYVNRVVMTTVDSTITKEEEGQCQEICDRLGIEYRVRAWES
ncbi:TIGR04100 family radical SAM protein [Parasporobacterium paucivorans]|uniref:Radical SAM enzyme, TIGR04100 family n=1 Tax=Parasporobacterium paucivorans DSM 15970 TaxID=1122934 RepID=A0A1M6AJS8_9FIRM|nr:TIGR04100 family radical SAM protein [Parasporobacterium paucivorans]SHI36473.1 radical SAM enzyme, TIGR04100 family [Parasporobacterium paucivorans DSM 15970]